MDTIKLTKKAENLWIHTITEGSSVQNINDPDVQVVLDTLFRINIGTEKRLGLFKGFQADQVIVQDESSGGGEEFFSTIDELNDRLSELSYVGFNTGGGSGGSGATLENRVIVNQGNVASTLGGVIDPDKEYFIDGVVDCSGVPVTVPQALNIRGYDFNISKLICTDDNFTLFSSDGDGSGNFFANDIAFEISGTNSRVFNLVGETGNEAIEFNSVNFDNCTSLGSVESYRQGLEMDTGRFGGTPELELIGTWIGGYRVSTAIARGVGNATLFKAGAGLLLQGRFFSNFNMDGETNATFCDFSPSNIQDDEEFEILDGNFNGVTDPFPNMPVGDPKARFKNNVGILNTFVGGRWMVTAESTTTIPAINTPVKLDGTTTYEDLQWFTSSGDNALVYNSDQSIEFQVNGVVSLGGANNRQITVYVRQWDDSAGQYIDLIMIDATLNGGGGNRAEGISVLAFGIIDKDDRLELWVENRTDATNITLQNGGLFSVSERA